MSLAYFWDSFSGAVCVFPLTEYFQLQMSINISKRNYSLKLHTNNYLEREIRGAFIHSPLPSPATCIAFVGKLSLKTKAADAINVACKYSLKDCFSGPATFPPFYLFLLLKEFVEKSVESAL